MGEAEPLVPNDQLETSLHQIYREYRSVLLSAKFYGEKREKSRTLLKRLDIAISLGACAAFGSLLSKAKMGAAVWAAIAAISALATTFKTALGVSATVDRYNKLYSGYNVLYYDFKDLADSIAREERLTVKNLETFKALLTRYKPLLPDEDPPTSDPALRRLCTDEVNAALPSSHFWMPPLEETKADEPSEEEMA